MRNGKRSQLLLVVWQASFGEGYINEADPSVLRFLIASREEVSARQLRDDLLSMLVAGHETTGSVLTWTLYLLEQNPQTMAKVGLQCHLATSAFPGLEAVVGRAMSGPHHGDHMQRSRVVFSYS